MPDAKEHGSKKIKEVPFEADDAAVFDCGYVDYGYFAPLNGQKVWFVTRLKKNVKFKQIKKHKTTGGNTVSDCEIIIPAYPPVERLGKIISIDRKTGKKTTIPANNLKRPTNTTAATCKDRWKAELFFKAIKPNLKIKRFYGNSRNAVLAQIWTALAVYPFYYLLKAQSKNGGAFIYQFHTGNTDNAVSKNKPNRVAYRPVSPVEDLG
jgi:IS4 transposase